MLSVRNRPPMDYSLCSQTVTVYHRREDGGILRTVHKRAFLDFRKNQSIDKTGSREVNSFLLVIPCAAPCVFVGDKVLLGEGPALETAEEWARFIPANTPGLVVVSQVDPKYYRGRLCHIEAGG